jgi:hypothetical protein
MAVAPKQQSIIPDLPRDFVAVGENGAFIPNWSLFFDLLIQALQSNFTPEGNLFPRQTNANIALLTALNSVANILYNGDNNCFEGNILNPAYDPTIEQANFWVPFAMITTNAGNPNGIVQGIQFTTFCWDTSNSILYICTSTGSATTAVWTAT